MTSLLLLAVLLQADDFQKRVKVDGTRVLVDDRPIYEGTWRTADVTVRESPGRPPWKSVIVLIDGQERVRLPVRSLAKPVAWPPCDAEELRPVLKKRVETTEHVQTLVLLVTTDKGDAEIYRGEPAETRVDRTPEAFTVYLADRPLYRVARRGRRPATPDEVLAALNVHRERAKVPRVRHAPGLSRGCDLHALYLAKNDWKGLSGHDEDPKGAGYTDEGARAGKRSVISPFAGHESPFEALEGLMATLYHRVSVLAPGLTEVGVGWAWRRDGLGYLVIDVGSVDARHDPKLWPVLYPAPGQADVPLDFGLGAREAPNPLPEGVDAAGYPVTIQFPERVEKVLDLELTLSEGGRDVPGYLSTPDAPARKDWPQPGVVSLIPKAKLKPGTSYVVRLRYRDLGAAREWTFTTRK
ncbi:MAG TPA: CAP domain-containing protein [Planctomycetota bacterium]